MTIRSSKFKMDAKTQWLKSLKYCRLRRGKPTRTRLCPFSTLMWLMSRSSWLQDMISMCISSRWAASWEARLNKDIWLRILTFGTSEWKTMIRNCHSAKKLSTIAYLRRKTIRNRLNAAKKLWLSGRHQLVALAAQRITSWIVVLRLRSSRWSLETMQLSSLRLRVRERSQTSR